MHNNILTVTVVTCSFLNTYVSLQCDKRQQEVWHCSENSALDWK